MGPGLRAASLQIRRETWASGAVKPAGRAERRCHAVPLLTRRGIRSTRRALSPTFLNRTRVLVQRRTCQQRYGLASEQISTREPLGLRSPCLFCGPDDSDMLTRLGHIFRRDRAPPDSIRLFTPKQATGKHLGSGILGGCKLHQSGSSTKRGHRQGKREDKYRMPPLTVVRALDGH